MDPKKQESGKSSSGAATPSFLIRFHADSDELQVEEIAKSDPLSADKCEEEESQGSSDSVSASVSACSSPISLQDVDPLHNRDASPIKDYLSRFKRSITIDSCSPVEHPVAAGGDNRNFFSDFKGRLAKRVEDKLEEIRNDRIQKQNKASKESSFSDIDSDLPTPESSPTVKTAPNPLSSSCSNINNAGESRPGMVRNESLEFIKSKQIEKLSIYLDNKLSNQESLKSTSSTTKVSEKVTEKKENVGKKLVEKSDEKEATKGGKKSFKKTISELRKSDPSLKSYFSNRKSSYLSQGVIDAEKVEEAEEAGEVYKMNQQPEVSRKNASIQKVQLRRKISIFESMILIVNWWKTVIGLVILSIVHFNSPTYVTAFLAGFFISVELRNVFDLFLKKFGFSPTTCGDDVVFYSAFLNEEGIPLLSDSAIFNSPPEKIVHQDWMNELSGDYNAEGFHLSQTETVYVHLDGPLLFISTPRFKIPKRAVWSEPQYKMLFNEKRMYLITNCTVDVVPEGLIRKRKWSRRFPIRIKLLSHSFIGACVRGTQQTTIDENAVWVPASDYIPRTTSDLSLVLPGDTQSDFLVNEEQNKGLKLAAEVAGLKDDAEKQKTSKDKTLEESTVTRHQLDQNERYFKKKLERENDKQTVKPLVNKFKSASADNIDKINEESASSELLDRSEFSLPSSMPQLNENIDSDFVHVDGDLSEDDISIGLGTGSSLEQIKCGKKSIILDKEPTVETEMLFSRTKDGAFPTFGNLIENHEEVAANSQLNSKEEGIYLYLFCRTNRQKEAWFNYLSAATKFKIRHGEIKTEEYDPPKDPIDLRDSSEVPLAARKNKYLTYMYNLQQNVVPKIYPDISLPKDSMSAPEVEIQLMWLNAIIGRFTHEFSKNQVILNFIKKKIQQKLGLIPLPRFMDALNISNLEVDDVYPVIKRAGRPTLDDRGIWVDLDVVYSGSSKIAIDTKLNLLNLKKTDPKTVISASMTNLVPPDVPSSPDKPVEPTQRRSAAFHSDVESETSENSSDEEPLIELSIPEDQLKSETPSSTKQRSQMKTGQKVLKFVDKFTSTKFFDSLIENKYVKRVVQNVSNTDLSLMVELKWLCGTLVINIPPPPIDRIWIGFRGNPKIVLSCYPRLGETEVSYMEVSKWIRKLLIREMEKNLVLPNMEDILIPSELLF